MRLINRTTIPVFRRLEASGYLDENNRWVEGNEEDCFNIKCSIQPFRNGDEQIELPEGVRTEEVRYVFTKTELFTNDENLEREADEIEYKDFRWECFSVEDWTGHRLRTDHYRCVFIRKDKQ